MSSAERMIHRSMAGRGRKTAALLLAAVLAAGCGNATSDSATAQSPAGGGDPAATEIEQLLQVDGQDAMALYEAGVALLRRGEAEGSIRQLEAARALAPEMPALHKALSLAYEMAGRMEDAKAALRRTLELDADDWETAVKLSDFLLKANDLEAARQLLEPFLAGFDDQAMVLIAVATLENKSGNAPMASALYQRALALQPNHADALYGLGIIARQEGRLGDAAGHFSTILAQAPTHIGALLSLGAIQLDQNRLPEAQASFARALELEPRLFIARRSLGNTYLLQGLYDEAVQLFEEGKDLTPQDPQVHFYLGKAYLQRGLIDKAEKEFEYVAATEQQSWEAYLELARITSLQGDLDRSQNALRMAISYGYQDIERLGDDPDFENLFDITPHKQFVEFSELYRDYEGRQSEQPAGS